MIILVKDLQWNQNQDIRVSQKDLEEVNQELPLLCHLNQKNKL